MVKDPTFNENNDNAVGVEQIQMEVSELVLYPNPAKHSIQIEFKSVDKKPMLVKIYNSLGVCISEKSIDQVYGDRGGNYHGIGIWLRDSLVLNSEDFAEIIQKLLIHRSSVKDWKSMGAAVEKAVNHIKIDDFSNIL